ncbi:MAG: ABC transporter permease subunit [Ruthenibacterium lactatiformans]
MPAFFGGAYYIFLLRQFFKSIPDSLLEAAEIDGAGEVRIFAQIMLPLCKPAMASVAIFTFINMVRFYGSYAVSEPSGKLHAFHWPAGFCSSTMCSGAF